MRFSNVLSSIPEPQQHRQNFGIVSYRLRTTNGTTTEAFIDGVPGRRLVPSADSTFTLYVKGVANGPGTTHGFVDSVYMYRVNAAGVITASDIDGTTGGVNGAEIAVTALGGGAAVTKTSVLTALNISPIIVPATATSPAYIAFNITGNASQNIDWELMVTFIEAGSRG